MSKEIALPESKPSKKDVKKISKQQIDNLYKGKSKEEKKLQFTPSYWRHIIKTKEISPLTFLEKFELDEIESENLQKVFSYLCSACPDKPEEDRHFITDEDIKYAMIYFYEIDRADKKNERSTKDIDKEEISLMIWEVDDDLDGRISMEEFMNIYKRILLDEEYLEPRKFYNLIEFLMYNLYEVPKDEKPVKRYITKEDCYKLMYIRKIRYCEVQSGESGLDAEMEWLFDGKYNHPDFPTNKIRNETQGRNKNLDKLYEDYVFEDMQELKLDEFIRRKYEDIIFKREKYSEDRTQKYKDYRGLIDKK